MKQLKLLTVLTILALALVCFAACGKTTTDTSTDTSTSGDTQKVEEKVHMIYDDTDTEKRSTIQCAYWLQQKWEEETNGACVMEVFCNNTLGDDDEVLKGLLLGTCDVFSGMGVLPDVIGTKGALVDMPFVFESYDDWYNGNYNEGGLALYQKLFDGTGYYCYDLMYAGAKQIVSNSKNYETLADLKGFKIRCSANDMNILQWKTLGANPATVSWGELYTALTQKTVDGVEHTLGICVDQGFYEPCPYFTIANTTYCPYVCVCSQKWMDALDPEYKDYVMDSLHQMTMKQHELELDAEKNQYMKTLQDAGCTITTIPTETRDQMKDLCKVCYQFMYDSCGQDIVDAYVATAGKADASTSTTTTTTTDSTATTTAN